VPEPAPYAELIGDPVAHSMSPAIHNAWLRQLLLEGEYRATPVTQAQVGAHLALRRADPFWRGCNVTAPLKQAVIPHLNALDPSAQEVGAVNCIMPQAGRLTGFNTDVDGALHALAEAEVHRGKAVIVGSGGAARAAVGALRDLGACRIVILARTPGKAESIFDLAPDAVEIRPFATGREAMRDAQAVVNASPLGMAGADPMPPWLLEALDGAAAGATVLDMVYAPLETDLLLAARAAGLRPVDGLTMLVGQARRAFELFFGQVAPERSGPIAALRAG
jgi:shikimate dehydrogenase